MDDFPDEDELQELIQQQQQSQRPSQSQPICNDDPDGDLVVDLPDVDDDLDALEHLQEVEDKENRFKKSLFQQQNAPGEPGKRPRTSDDLNLSTTPLLDLSDSLDNVDRIGAPSQTAPPPAKRLKQDEISASNFTIHRRIPEGEFQSVTLNDGARFYLSLRSKERKEAATSDSATASQGPSGLCGTAYATLKDQAMLELSKMQSPGARRELDLEEAAVESHDSGVESMDEEQPQTELWVEKFRPRSYVELLSDDGTNRVLLKWLKLWDKVVFGREVRVRNKNKKDEEEEGNPQKAKNKPQQGKFKKKFVELDIDDELDGSGRPKLKMAMLHGPPGLGKTTLAHVIANHAGYNVVEMNASDDRSLEAFRTKLDSATQMRSVNSKDQRPNCLVIDEIDGAPAPVINHLIGIVTGNAGKKGKKKPAAKGDGLQRPIICICNDLFVPALRPLRQHCMVFPFPPTLCSRLAQRLGDIAGRQRLRTDTTALIALCEKADNDIRSCLSTLQFFHSRGKPLRKDDVQKANVGQKDVEKGHFAVWRELFEIPRASMQRHAQVNGQTVIIEESAATAPNRYRSMLSTVYAGGDYGRVMEGVFENYLDIKFKDMHLENVLKGHEFMLFFDLAQQQISRSQIYSLMAYMPFSFVAAHFVFAANGRAKIVYPHTNAERTSQLTKSKNLLSSMIAEMSPTARIFSSPTNLVFDILPILLEILEPNLRPVNTQLYSSREKEELRALVDTMTAYNLTYVQERTEEGQYAYKLDPSVDDIAHFPTVRPQRRTLSYALKQLVSHEIDLQRMRREEGAAGPPPAAAAAAVAKESRKAGPTHSVARQQPAATAEQQKEEGEEEAATPRHLQRLQAKRLDAGASERSPVDFFGRPIDKTRAAAAATASAGGAAAEKANSEIVSSDIWFKFKEGYNNAVRRLVRLRDLQ